MALCKLLPQITITGSNDLFAFTRSGAKTAEIDEATYDTILEVCANLQTKLVADSAAFSVSVSSGGIVSISNATTSWAVNWAGTDSGFQTLMGFTGSESVTGAGPYVLTATNRHLYGFYSPVGVQYPADRRRVESRIQETDAGGLTQLASTATHRYRAFQSGLLSEAQLDAGGTDSDGAGGSVSWTSRTLFDFWSHVRDKHFRFYPDRATGTVASPGTEGTTFWTCRRTDTDWAPSQRDPGDWSFFDVTIPCKITGE